MHQTKVFLTITLIASLLTIRSYAQIDAIAIKDSTHIASFEHFFLPMKVVSGDTLHFDADTTNYTFNWTVDGSPIEPEYGIFLENTDTIPYFVYAFDSNGTFDVGLEIVNDTSGLTYFTSLTITLDNAIDVPNVFTPDGDGVNDLFVVKSSGDANNKLKLQIYTRNGDLLYEKIAPVVYWDGRLASGNYAKQGVYYYIVVPQNDPDLAKKGFFHLYR